MQEDTQLTKPERLMNKTECAEFLRIKGRTLDKYVAAGKIPVLRLSQKITRFNLADVIAALRCHQRS